MGQDQNIYGGKGSGSKFVSFDRYFDANAGTAQSTAEGLLSPLEQKADTAKRDFDTAASVYRDQSAVSAQSSRPGRTPKAPATDATGASGVASQVQKQQDDVQSQLNQMSARYGADNAVVYTGGSSTPFAFDPGTSGLADQAQALTTQEGRQTALQQQNAGAQGYSQRMSAWDAALAGVAGQPTFEADAAKFKTLDQYFSDQTAAANAYAQQQADRARQKNEATARELEARKIKMDQARAEDQRKADERELQVNEAIREANNAERDTDDQTNAIDDKTWELMHGG